MAIEIKELIIKMNVMAKPSEKLVVSGELSSAAKNRIIKECVDRVLQQLESKVER